MAEMCRVKIPVTVDSASLMNFLESHNFPFEEIREEVLELGAAEGKEDIFFKMDKDRIEEFKVLSLIFSDLSDNNKKINAQGDIEGVTGIIPKENEEQLAKQEVEKRPRRSIEPAAKEKKPKSLVFRILGLIFWIVLVMILVVVFLLIR